MMPTPIAATTPRPQSEAGMSIVVPVFNEGVGLAQFHAQLVGVVRQLRQQRGLATEVIYVDDGSRDDSLAVANTLPAEALDIQVVSLSRNFGKEAALLAGLDHARFGAVLFMDGDGQHPPALIPTLVGHWLDGGNDVVFTAKAHRASEPALRRFGVRTFYWLLNWKTKAPDSRRMPATSGCCRRAPPRRCAGCPSETVSSRGSRAGSASSSSASIMSRPNARTAPQAGVPPPSSACRSKA